MKIENSIDDIFYLEAEKILHLYQKADLDEKLYLVHDPFKIDLLFDEVIDGINNCGMLKVKLPFIEFVKPAKAIAQHDSGWVGHFEDRDNKRFYLSDVYDYLTLFYAPMRARSA